jgi:hypothetical protein
VAGQGRHLGNLATFQSPLGDRALIGRCHVEITLPLVMATECLKTLRKNIPQSIGNTGYFSQGLAAFSRIMLDPKG